MVVETKLAHKRSLTPIKLWGGVGAVSLIVVVVVLGRWVAGGITSVEPGPDPFTGSRLILLRVLEWGQFAALLALLGWFVIRPLVRRRPLGFDGLFVLAAILLNFWDPLDNYWVFSFQYNAHFLNVGSWGGFIPGWRSPGAGIWAVPILFVLGAYTWAFVMASRLGSAIVYWLESARPAWSAVQRFAVVFVVMALLCAVAESIFLRTDAMANIRPAEALSVWPGRHNQWPLYDPVLFGIVWTAMAWLRWSRDGGGLSAVERGAGQLAVGPRTRTAVRFLAISAFTQVTYIALYFVPWNLFASLNTAPAPVPSYFPTP